MPAPVPAAVKCGQFRTYGRSTFICIADPHPSRPDSHYMVGHPPKENS